HHRSLYRADLEPVCDSRPARHVLPAGRHGRALLAAEIWPGRNPGVYRRKNAADALVPYTGTGVARRHRADSHRDAVVEPAPAVAALLSLVQQRIHDAQQGGFQFGAHALRLALAAL